MEEKNIVRAKRAAIIAKAVSIMMIAHFFGLEYLFTSVKRGGMEIQRSFLLGVIGVPDFLMLLLCAVVYYLTKYAKKQIPSASADVDRQRIHKNASRAKTVAIVFTILSFTTLGTVFGGFGAEINYGIHLARANTPEEAARVDQEFNDGTELAMNDCVTRDISQVDCKIDARLVKSSENQMTKARVEGTITNNSDDVWKRISIEFVATDASGQTVLMEQLGNQPAELSGSVESLYPGETASFETNWYPGVLEADYANLSGCKLAGGSLSVKVES